MHSKLLSGSRSTLICKRIKFFDTGVALRSFSDKVETSSSDAKVSVEEFRKLHNIKLQGSQLKEYEPMTEFDSTPFHSALKLVCTSQGFTSPTPIQAQSWPIVMEKRDVISVARTGSGKTIGFLFPALHKITLEKLKPPPIKRKFYRPPSVLVLAPTRELTVQIESEARKFASALSIHTTAIYGGESKDRQLDQLRRGVDVAICTPGRCNDLAELGALDLSTVNYLVLDEADRMLDMGFEPQIRSIIDRLPKDRQTLFFTATWPKEVQQLAGDYLKDPVQINVGEENVLNANSAIKQNFLMVPPFQKEEALMTLLQGLNEENTNRRKDAKTLIFVQTKGACTDLMRLLSQEGFHCDALHGDRSQRERDYVMQQFRVGRVRILIATNLAARGLDVKDIENVINYDFPIGDGGIEDYVHRIGRTARGFDEGTAFSFLAPKDLLDLKNMHELADLLQRAKQEVPKEIATASREYIKRRSPPPRNQKYRMPGQSLDSLRSKKTFTGKYEREDDQTHARRMSKHRIMGRKPYRERMMDDDYQNDERDYSERRPARRSFGGDNRGFDRNFGGAFQRPSRGGGGGGAGGRINWNDEMGSGDGDSRESSGRGGSKEERPRRASSQYSEYDGRSAKETL